MKYAAYSDCPRLGRRSSPALSPYTVLYNQKLFGDPDKPMTSDKILQTVFTGEIFQPVRIYYHVFDKKAVLRVFAKLRCMTFDRPRDRWVWLYEKEAKKLKFKHAYSAIPKEMHPIVLGSFFFREADKMIVDLRSFERATKAIMFFDKKIIRSAAKVTDMAVVNRLFDVSEGSQPGFDIFFDSNKVIEKDPNAIFEEVASLKEETASDHMAKAISMIEEKSKEPLPEIEKFPVYFYEDGIASVEHILKMRQTIAIEHWLGNENYSFFDLLKKVVPS